MLFGGLKGIRIEATVFICGALLMALEIIGARLLTPYYGDTIYVWGSVIGIILLSLSLGYFLGGKLADRKPEPWVLSLVLELTGLFIIAVPFVYMSIVDFSSMLPRMFAPMMSVTLLFFIPSLLLGTVSPFALKLKAKTIKKIGNLSGRLYAISTIGSFIGTFLATFVLVLLLPTTTIFFCLGATSFAVAALMSSKKQALVLITAAALIFLIAISSNISALIAESGPVIQPLNQSKLDALTAPVIIESLYGQIRVNDNSHSRSLSLNGGIMSEMDLRNQTKVLSGWEYIECMMIPFAENPDISNALAMGLGAGIYPRKVHDDYRIDVESVEINDKIFEVAQKYFGVTVTDSFRVYIDDARAYLQATDKKYDLISVDTYKFDPSKGYKLPFHLATKEFFQLVKEHLNPGGVVTLNYVTDKDSSFVSSEYKTLQTVFSSVRSFDCNTQVLMASDNPVMSLDQLEQRAPNKASYIGRYYEMTLTNKSIVLTDDFSPVNPFVETG